MDLDGFDADQVEPDEGFSAIPAGKYTAIIIDSEERPTKAGDGSYLEFAFQVVEGDYQNRLLWSKLNLGNKSEKAVKIARGQLSAICKAVGVMKPKESSELHDKPLVITVKCCEYNGDIQNEISSYAKEGTATQSTTDDAPWKRA